VLLGRLSRSVEQHVDGLDHGSVEAESTVEITVIGCTPRRSRIGRFDHVDLGGCMIGLDRIESTVSQRAS
jgi:hypothetical protein